MLGRFTQRSVVITGSLSCEKVIVLPKMAKGDGCIDYEMVCQESAFIGSVLETFPN